MKKIFTVLFVMTLSLNAQLITPFLYHTNANNWSGDGITGVFRNLGINSWAFTFQANQTVSNYYKINNQENNSDNNFNTPSDSKVWSGDLTVNNTSKATIYLYGDGNGGAAKFEITNTKFYTLIWKDVNNSSNSYGFVFETSSTPVSIISVTDNYVNSENDVVVNITLSDSKSPEENVFVRYTTDSWVTDNFILATGSGTSYSATIPKNFVGTPGDEYYVLTTTLDKTTMEGLNEDVDLATIFFNNNSGSNFVVPVELTTFSALVTGNNVKLNWETATEVNNYGFEIERKSILQSQKVQSNTSDIEGYKVVGFVEGHGTSNSPKVYSYSDKLTTSGKYLYRLKQIDIDGSFEYSEAVEIFIEAPKEFKLGQNYPNPFNPVTVIQFSLPEETNVKMVVYNAIGEKILQLLNQKISAGNHQLSFDGSKLNSGIYFYQLETDNFVQTRKMLLLK